MSQLFIQDYFKNNLDSIKNFQMKVKETNKVTKDTNKVTKDTYTIYFEDNDYYAINNNDISTAKHITMFTVSDILNMCIGPNVNQIELENFILSIIYYLI